MIIAFDQYVIVEMKDKYVDYIFPSDYGRKCVVSVLYQKKGLNKKSLKQLGYAVME
jgi:hypothetical protein